MSAEQQKSGRVGGARPGAGRPTKQTTRTRDELNRLINGEIAGRLDEILGALIALAVGIRAVRTTEKGEEVVYTTVPDRAALCYLIDRAAGKPPLPFAFEPASVDIRSAVEKTRAAAASYVDPDGN